MKIMVTGGAGFIGSHLSKRLLADGHNVLVVDDLSSGSLENIPAEVQFLELDLAEEAVYKELPTDIDIVYHLASQSSGEISYEDPVHDLKANALSTLALLQWAKKVGVQKFIFTSTMGVYDDTLKHKANETSPVAPKSFYGVTKYTCEGFIRIFNEEGMRTTIFRLFNVYGPGQNMANLKQGMVSIYMAYVFNKQPVCVKGSLERTRDFVYIDDVVNALRLGLSEQADEGLFNVCTGRKYSVGEVLKEIFSAFGELTEYPVEIKSRTPRDIDHSLGDYKAINEALGWQPRVSFEEGVTKMVNWLNGRREKENALL